MSRVPFYDNLEPTPVPDEPSVVEFERVYCLELARFTEEDWASLAIIYRGLPGEYREHQLPYWFGDSDESPRHISASVEPSGLQVCGVLTPRQWSEWDTAFREALEQSQLPFRDL